MGGGGEGGPGGAWPMVAAFGPVRPPATKIGEGGGPGSIHGRRRAAVGWFQEDGAQELEE